MLLQDKTKQYQSSLANYCRTGQYNAIPGVNEKNVGQYRRLVFNIIKGSLDSAYPLTRDFLPGARWDELVERFFSVYPCQSPQVWYMPREFYGYVESKEKDLIEMYPLISSLLWFEWLEIEVYMMEDIPVEYSDTGDYKTDKLVLNPEIRLIRLEYPVHLKNAAEIRESDRADYYLSIHRLPDTGSVRFTDLSLAFVRLLEIIDKNPISLTHIVRKLSEELNIIADSGTIDAISNFVKDAIDKKLIIGYKK